MLYSGFFSLVNNFITLNRVMSILIENKVTKEQIAKNKHNKF